MPNARHEPLPEAAAQRRLEAIGSMPLFGWVSPCAPLADHLIRLEEKRWGHGDPKRLGGLEVDDQLELRGLLDREVPGLGAPQNLVDIDGPTSCNVQHTRRVG